MDCGAYQSMGFSRQEYWSGLPFPSTGDLSDPAIEPGFPMLQADALPSEKEKVKIKVTQSCLPLCDPMDCRTSGSSVHGILQPRVLEWGDIPFSRRSSQPRHWTQSNSHCRQTLPSEVYTVVDSVHSTQKELTQNNDASILIFRFLYRCESKQTCLHLNICK